MIHKYKRVTIRKDNTIQEHKRMLYYKIEIILVDLYVVKPILSYYCLARSIQETASQRHTKSLCDRYFLRHIYSKIMKTTVIVAY